VDDVPSWLNEAPLLDAGDQDGEGEPPAYWYGDDTVKERRRAPLGRANPADFAPEASLRYHRGEPEDIPLGSAFSAVEWAQVRAGLDVRATAVEIDTGHGRALVSASWDELGNSAFERLGAERLRLVASGVSSHPEMASLGRISLDADHDRVGESLANAGLPAGVIRVGSSLVDADSGEVLGPAPAATMNGLELARLARDSGQEFLAFTAPKDWLALRAHVHQEREQAWYDTRQVWPRHTPVAIIHRPMVSAEHVPGLGRAAPDWLVAAQGNLGVIGPGREGARWTEGEARAVVGWLNDERDRPENQGSSELALIRLEDVAIIKLTEVRAGRAPSALTLIETLVRHVDRCIPAESVHEEEPRPMREAPNG
jgi:hypothetical protein